MLVEFCAFGPQKAWKVWKSGWGGWWGWGRTGTRVVPYLKRITGT